MRLRSISLVSIALILVLTSLLGTAVVAQLLPVRVDRWLSVQQVVGTVTFRHANTSQPAQINTRLEAVGDALLTGKESSASLAVDTGIGFVNMAANTTLEIEQLDTAPDGSRLTRLKVTGGQVRLELRPFNHPSHLEIETPAGTSGVRGTTFGVSVRPDGSTGVATQQGSVLAEAQGQTVHVDAGLQSLIIPGAPPSPPTPLREDTHLNVKQLLSVRQQIRIVGEIDPVNILEINGEPQVVSHTGEFDLLLSPSSDRRVIATIITPLGTQQTYQLTAP